MCVPQLPTETTGSGAFNRRKRRERRWGRFNHEWTRISTNFFNRRCTLINADSGNSNRSKRRELRQGEGRFNHGWTRMNTDSEIFNRREPREGSRSTERFTRITRINTNFKHEPAFMTFRRGEWTRIPRSDRGKDDFIFVMRFSAISCDVRGAEGRGRRSEVGAGAGREEARVVKVGVHDFYFFMARFSRI
jgi:hypothetical protein